MGYRCYIAPISKEEHSKIKGMTLKEVYEYKGENIDDEMSCVSVFDIPQDYVYNFGKYTDFIKEGNHSRFFDLDETNKHFTEENDLWIVSKEFLLGVIEEYRGYVKSYYNKMREPFFVNDFKGADFVNSVKRDYNTSDGDFKETFKFDFSKITDEQQTALFKVIEHLRDMHLEWSRDYPYDINDGNDKIVSSWKYEYAVFELVRIYKTFDWENNLMVFYGY